MIAALVAIGITTWLSWMAYITKQIVEHAKWMAAATVTENTTQQTLTRLMDLMAEHDRWERDRAISLLDRAIAQHIKDEP